MAPHDQERLTPRQQQFFACVFFVIFLTFVGFVWLIGVNAANERERLLTTQRPIPAIPHGGSKGPNLVAQQANHKLKTRFIVQGSQGAARYVESRVVPEQNFIWLASTDKSNTVYSSDEPCGWEITFGHIKVPADATPGRYTVLYNTMEYGDWTQYTYTFEVIKKTKGNRIYYASDSLT